MEKSLLPISRGTWLYVGGIGPGNYTRIKDAVDNASDGDTVFVYSGIYQEEKILVNHSISIIGENKNTTITDSSDYIFSLNKNFINITGFTIQHGYGIWIRSHYDKIFNNIFTNLISAIIANSTCQIENNIFFNINGTAILCSMYGNGYDNVIQNNTIIRCELGINLDEEVSNVIQNNIIVNNTQAIVIHASEQSVIYHNIIRNNTKDGIYLEVSDFDKITSNNITWNGKGITLLMVNGDLISKNNIYSNKINTFFITLPFFPNFFLRNYWGTRLFPIKLIFGLAMIPFGYFLNIYIPWFNSDLFPRWKPYNF